VRAQQGECTGLLTTHTHGQLAGHGKGKQHKLNTALQDIEDSLSDARDTNQFQAALPRDASGSYLIPHAGIVYVCVYTCVKINIYIYLYIYESIYIYVHTCIHTYILIHLYTYI